MEVAGKEKEKGINQRVNSSNSSSSSSSSRVDHELIVSYKLPWNRGKLEEENEVTMEVVGSIKELEVQAQMSREWILWRKCKGLIMLMI